MHMGLDECFFVTVLTPAELAITAVRLNLQQLEAAKR